MNTELNEDKYTVSTLLESILDQQSEMICRILPEGYVLFANESFCSHLRKTKSAVIGNKIGDFYDISQRRRLNERIEYLKLNKKKIEVEQQVKFSQGKGEWQRWTYTPILDQHRELQSIQIAGKVIDDEKKLKENLLHTQQKFEALFKGLSYPLLLLDPQSKIQAFNKTAEALLSQTFGQRVEIGQAIKTFVYPEDMPRFFLDFERALHGEVISREIFLKSSQGQSLWQEFNLSPISDEFGNILFVALGFNDVSKQKYLEQHTHQQKAINAIFVKQVPSAMWVKDFAGRFEYVSPSFAQLLDLSPEYLIGKKESELSHIQIKTLSKTPENPSEISQPLVYTQEIKTAGYQKLIKTYETPVYGNSNEFLGFVGKVQEVKEQELLTNKIISNHQKKYLDFAKNLPNGGLFIFDTDFICQYAVGPSLFLLGTQPSQTLFQKFTELFPWHKDTSLAEDLNRALVGEKRMLEFEYNQKYYLAQLVPVQATELVTKHIMMIVLDISSTKATEKILQESEHKLQSYIQNAPEGIWILNQNGNIEYTNTTVQKQLGMSPQYNLQGKHFTDFFRNGRNLLDWHAITEHKTYKSESLELSLVKINQKRIPILIDIAQVSPETLICFTRDISELKKTEKALKKAKRNAEVNAENQVNFLSVMSHEIRTPMNSVIAMTHFLLQENPKPEQIKNLNILKFSAENLLVLINDILDYNKIEAGKTTFEQIDFDLRDLINSISQTLSYKAANKQIEILIEYKNQVPHIIIGDPVRMSQILTNLVDNAIKFTSKGYVKIEVNAERLDKDHFDILFSVKDTGIGIDASKIQHIFQRFTQAEQDTTRKFGGTGLGLAITKRLIELQGGEILVESERGVGSKFFFNLKFKKGDKRNLESIRDVQFNFSDAPDFDLHGCKILIVEDNEMNQMVVSQFLQKWNAEPDFAHNGEIAIDLLQKNHYDLVLMDIEMPVMNGYQTTERIRSLKGVFKDLPIIALTASTISEVEKQVEESGMNGYMSKPFKPKELFEVIASHLPSHKYTQDKNTPKSTPMSKTGKIDYHKVIDISGGNKAFIRKYNQLAVKVFADFPDEYAFAILNQDFEKLRKIHHNIRATIGLLGLDDLETEIKNGRDILQQDEPNEQAIGQTIKQVKNLCKEYSEYLNNYF